MIGLSSFLALALAVTLWVVLRDEEYVAPRPGPSSTLVRPAEAAAALETLAEAVERRDEDAAVAVAGNVAAEGSLTALVRNAAAIPLTDFDLRYVDELGGADAAGTWRATASMAWRFRGFDRDVSITEVEVRFARSEDGVAIAGIGGEGREPVWLASPVEVRRTPRTLVVAAARADRYDRLARRAVTVVRRVVRDWRGGLVLEVPDTASGIDRALGAEPGDFANVAGVTAVPDGDGPSAHVFLNPERLDRLRPPGAQVVVSHEAAHVALGATASELPVWLAEGFADYVALREVSLPLSVTASQVIDQVQRAGPPRTLPGDEEFDDESEHFGASYEAAWLACRLLAERAGEDTLLGFYRRADGAEGFARLFRTTFGITLREFTRLWRQALTDLAA